MFFTAPTVIEARPFIRIPKAPELVESGGIK